MPAIFYLSLPPVEIAAAANGLSQAETPQVAEPHPFDDVIDRVASANGSRPAGATGSERRN